MSTTKSGWVKQLFESIDSKDTDSFLSFLSEDVCFRFGNSEPALGKVAVSEIVSNFFNSIMGLKHDLAKIWDVQESLICHGTVTYTRLDSTQISVPFANVLRFEGILVSEYLIFVDISELYGKD